MGNFRVEFEAVGGHGCQRSLGDKAEIKNCGQPGCPDCAAGELVKAFLERTGSSFVKGAIVHWPETESTVVDVLRPDGVRVRRGSF